MTKKMKMAPGVLPVASHLLVIFSIISLVGAQVLENCDTGYGNYTNGSIFDTNLQNLFSTLHSDIDQYGFANSSSGNLNSSDPAYAIFLCRGDFDYDTCRKCVHSSISRLTTTCPGYKQASGSYDGCMLRYSNRSLTGSVSAGLFLLTSSSSPTNITQFNQDLATLMIDLRTKAAKGGSHIKFAADQKDIPDFQTIYGLVQCTPDLTEQQCNNCLLDRISQIPSCCSGRSNAVVLTWSCFMLFQNNLFYNDTRATELLSPPPPAESPPPGLSTENNNGNRDQTMKIVIISIASAVGFISIISGLFFFIFKSRRSKKPRKNPIVSAKPIERHDSFEAMNDMSSTEIVQYDFKTIKEATDDFSIDNKLGQGGFGVVYKGLFSYGQHIAVKRLSRDHGQGDQEFKNEVILVAKLQHRNLVRILGFSIYGTERLLVYEFLANSSLDHILFDHEKRAQLNWQNRFKIILGIARGLLYLHEDSRLRIIHRDMKASNILLDSEMNPKISDFGMARLFVTDETQGNTSKIMGTFGYMAPEYMMYGNFSVKTDVYSFGILVLEIISGQKNNNSFNNGQDDILSLAWKCWREKRASDMIDPMLKDLGGSVTEMIRCIHIGLLCTQDNASDRPTMASVVLMFNSVSITLPLPSEPAFFSSRTGRGNPNRSEEHGLIRSAGANKHSEEYSIDNDTISELYPR